MTTKINNKKRLAKLDAKNPMWKGDEVGYFALHSWVYRRLERPDKCSRCTTTGKVDLANKSGKYRRDLTDWEWLCRRCHMTKDGRLDRLAPKQKVWTKTCPSCKQSFTRLGGNNGKRLTYCSIPCAAKSRARSFDGTWTKAKVYEYCFEHK